MGATVGEAPKFHGTLLSGDFDMDKKLHVGRCLVLWLVGLLWPRSCFTGIVKEV